MYRQPANPPAETPPAELVYGARERASRVPGLAQIQVFGLPAIVAVVLSVTVSPTAGLIGLLASAAVGVWWLRRKPAAGLVLRVERGVLSLHPGPTKPALASVRLEDLVDVVLETKTIQPVTDGGSAIPAMRFIDSRVAPEVDTARIALVERGASEPIRLGDAYLAHMEATEWFGKVRVFLRKHGWLPEGERGEAPPSERPG
jgi:hypothetical protein